MKKMPLFFLDVLVHIYLFRLYSFGSPFKLFKLH